MFQCREPGRTAAVVLTQRRSARVLAAILTVAVAASVLAFHHFVYMRVIPPNQQRYPTAGDWWFDAQGWHFRVSELPERRYEWLVFIHEFTEAALCRLMGMPQAEVDAFDIAYEKRRMGQHVTIPGKTDNVLLDDPGDDPAAPYHYEHLIASAVERAAAILLFVNWRAYNDALDALARAAALGGDVALAWR